ncbi:MAG: FAD-dependent oxidoreductase [Bacteroidota bacterium]
MFLSKGVHIVLPHEKFPIKNSIYFDVPDGRMLFAIPRGKITYLGTTDTPYKGNKENPRTNKEDVEYLINGLTHVFPSIQLKVEDVISSWAGLRPLIHEEGKSASEISRKDEIFISDSNLVSIAGGKLTGYRKMAERVVDEVADRLKRKYEIKSKKCKTHKIIISGGGYSSDEEVKSYIKKISDRLESYNFDNYVADYLVHNYGKQTDRIIDHFVDQEDHSEYGLISAELWYGLNFEMVNAAMDFFSRRTGRLYFNIQSVKDHKEALLAIMKDHLGWSDERYQQELTWVDQSVEEASHFPPEPQTT